MKEKITINYQLNVRSFDIKIKNTANKIKMLDWAGGNIHSIYNRHMADFGQWAQEKINRQPHYKPKK